MNIGMIEFSVTVAVLVLMIMVSKVYINRYSAEEVSPAPRKPTANWGEHMFTLTDFIAHHTEQVWSTRDNRQFAVPKNAYTRFRIIVEEQGMEAYVSSLERHDCLAKLGVYTPDSDAVELAQGLWDTLFTFMSPREISALMIILEKEMTQHKAKKKAAQDVIDVEHVGVPQEVLHVVV